MSGYIETGYNIERQAELHVAGETQRFEIRRPDSDGRPYIAVLGIGDDGKVTRDTLLLYADRESLGMDWVRLVSAEQVSVKDLGCIERIEWHATGYGNDGSLTLYQETVLMDSGVNNKNLPSYGVWEVWKHEPAPAGWAPENADDDEYALLGIFENYVDEVALQLERVDQRRYATFYFRPAAPGAKVDELPQKAVPEEAGLSLIRLDLPDGKELSDTPEALEGFFAGRPVVTDILNDSMFKGVRLWYLATEEGQYRLECKKELDTVLAKLNEGDIAVLARHGFRRYGA